METSILYQFINNSSQFVWWKDLDSVFLGCNENFAQYAGLKNASQLIGKTDYDVWEKGDADFFRKVDREIISTGKPQLNFEESLTLQDGGKRWLSTSKTPLYDKDKNIIGTLGWFNDITDFKEMQLQIDGNTKNLLEYSLQLERVNKDLELANSDLENFTYAASHDLKGPIRTMKSFATVLKQRDIAGFDDTSTKYLDFIHNAANRMESLINSILNYAQTGSKELTAEQVNLIDLVEDKLKDLKQLIESKSATIHLNLPSSQLSCYPHLIGLIFYNLINNGIKYNSSPTPTIDCSFIEEPNYWIFSIQDNGIGIEPQFTQQIFEPFKRLVGESIEGSGIGLSICKRVAAIHKGDIWIEESQQQGTNFKFSISKNLT